MGFRYKKVVLQAGSDSFPVGNTDALRRTRSESILKAVVEAIIASNTGWVLDTNRSGDSSTTSDFADVPCASGSITFPGLFLRNSQSGCKMFLAYFGGSLADSDIIPNFGSVDNLYNVNASTGTAHSGLICSIIPERSQNEFGSSFDNSFLPSDATRLIGTCYHSTHSSSYHPSHAYDPTNGRYYVWFIFVNQYMVSFASTNAADTNYHVITPVYAAGRILGTLAHSDDNAVNSKYGLICFRLQSTNLEGWSGELCNSKTILGDTYVIPGADPADTGYSALYACGCITKSDGTWINGTNKSNYVVLYLCQTPEMLASTAFSKSGESRWTPMYMMVRSSNLETYGVVSGDGLKGYLDTDLFRFARGTLGQTFDNDKFIIVNTPEYAAFAMGWDPNNTDSL